MSSFVWTYDASFTGVWRGERSDGVRFLLSLDANGSIRRIARWVNRPMKTTRALGFWTTVPLGSSAARKVAHAWASRLSGDLQ